MFRQQDGSSAGSGSEVGWAAAAAAGIEWNWAGWAVTTGG